MVRLIITATKKLKIWQKRPFLSQKEAKLPQKMAKISKTTESKNGQLIAQLPILFINSTCGY